METGIIKAVNQAAGLAVMALITLTATFQTRLLAREGGATMEAGEFRNSLAHSLNDNRRILGSYARCGLFQDI